MPTISAFDIDSISKLESQFFRTVEIVLKDVLHADVSVLNFYRMSFDEASFEEKLLTMHDDPLELAASLAGVVLTSEHLSRFNERLGFEIDYSVGRQLPVAKPVTLSTLSRALASLGYVPVPSGVKNMFMWELERSEGEIYPQLLTLANMEGGAGFADEPVFYREAVLDLFFRLSRYQSEHLTFYALVSKL